MKKTTVLNLVIIAAVIIAAMLAIAAPAFASGRCAFVEGKGWHIVGGGELSDHWYETETECLIALQVPTALATLQGPSETPSEMPPEATVEPSETPNPTETTLPTLEPTSTPGPIPIETYFPTDWVWTATPVATQAPPIKKDGMTCKKAWKIITETVYNRDVGFRFFDNPNHSYCKTWLWKKYGIDYDTYRLTVLGY